jgi:glycosyltransferase involved in cell wall biosynthesis
MSRILILAYRAFSHDARLRRNAEALARRGDSVDVVCLAIEGGGCSGPVNVIGLPAPRYRGKSKARYMMHYMYFFYRAFMTATRRSLGKRYDLVMAMSMPDAMVFGCLGAKLLGSKVVLDITDMMPELYRDRFGARKWDVGGKLLRLEERISAHAADRVLAVHEPHRRRLESAGINPAKIRVVMNSPDPRVFRAVERKRSANGEFVVVYHGSLIRRLGIDTAIQAVAIARHTIPGLRLRILGTGDYLDEAQALVRHLSLDNNVTFHGFLPVEEVARYVADADVGVVPYRLNEATHYMLPLKLLEYALMGVPVISARLEAVEYYFGSDGVRYFESGDAADLASAIEEQYRRPEVGAALVRKGRKAIEAISWDRQCKEFYEALDSVLAS